MYDILQPSLSQSVEHDPISFVLMTLQNKWPLRIWMTNMPINMLLHIKILPASVSNQSNCFMKLAFCKLFHLVVFCVPTWKNLVGNLYSVEQCLNHLLLWCNLLNSVFDYLWTKTSCMWYDMPFVNYFYFVCEGLWLQITRFLKTMESRKCDTKMV